MKLSSQVIALTLIFCLRSVHASDAPGSPLERALARRAAAITKLLSLDAATAARLRALDARYRSDLDAIVRDDADWKAELARRAAQPSPDYAQIGRLHELILFSEGRAAAIQVELLHGYRDLLGLPRYTKLMMSWDRLASTGEPDRGGT